jgi:phospholipid/cholesterol/gamma-HCH transport system substrate-binding protein
MTFSNSFKVGLVMAAAIGAAVFWFFSTTKGSLGSSDAYRVYAYLPTASGLSLKSRVTLGGLTIGQIEDIRLVDMDSAEVPPEDRADHTGKIRHGWHSKVTMWVRNKVPLRVNDRLAKETEGLIGSELLRVYPTEQPWDQPERIAAFIKDGEQLRHVEWEGAISKLSNVAQGIGGQVEALISANKDELTDIIRSVRGFMGPDPGGSPPPSFPALVQQLRDTVDDLNKNLSGVLRSADGVVRDNRQAVQEALDNINRVSSELRKIAEGTGERGVALDTMVRNVTQVTDDLRAVVADVKSIMGSGGGDGGPDGRPSEGIKRTVEKLNKNLEHLESVTDEIQKGDGTVGRLIKDDKVVTDLEDMVDGASGFVSGLVGTETHVDIVTWYNFRQGAAHSGISVKFQPKPDKYYLFELVSDPKRTNSIRDVTTRNLTDGTTKVERIVEVTDSFKATLMWAKMWGPMTLRIGMLENSGAVGANLNLWDNRFQLRTDLFQFSANRFPRLRTYGQLSLVPHIYFLAGLDDPLNANLFGAVPRQYLPFMLRRDWVQLDWRNPNSWGATDVFVGAGIFFTDEDLRGAFTQIPTSFLQ